MPDAYYKGDRILALGYCSICSSDFFMQGHGGESHWLIPRSFKYDLVIGSYVLILKHHEEINLLERRRVLHNANETLSKTASQVSEFLTSLRTEDCSNTVA